jgi:beta-lactamase class A
MAEAGWMAVRELVRGLPPETSVGIAAAAVDGGRSWGLNWQRTFPAASTIKVAILAALARALDAGRLALTDERVVDAEAIVQGSGVLLGMEPGLSLPLSDLAY